MMKEKSLQLLLKENTISQRTYDKVIVAKQYIENKYNLKTINNIEINNIIEKINSSNLPNSQKDQYKKEIIDEISLKSRKLREKQSIRDYESISIIGRGAFGEVHVCREIKTGNIVAIKKINKDILIIKNQITHARNEQIFMSKIKSEWIVDLKASFQENDYLYLVMEFLQGGDLMNLLIKKDILSEKESKFYLTELILAVESIHKLDCIHRDIKPDNILIAKDGHIKLSDFGLAKVSEKLYEKGIADENYNEGKLTHKKTYSCVGTAYYVAPEVLKKQGYGQEIDWWSVGVIFFEMLCGYAPFCSKETNDVCFKVINFKKYLKIPQKIKLSKEAEDLIFKLITNSNTRLGKNGADEIKSHPFFKDIKWDKIRSAKPPFIPDLKNDYDTKYFQIFEVKEPLYPLEKKNKRKDIEYLGYTYKEGENTDDIYKQPKFQKVIEILDSLNHNNLDSTDNTDNNSNKITENKENKKNNNINENNTIQTEKQELKKIKVVTKVIKVNGKNTSPYKKLIKRDKNLSPQPKQILVSTKYNTLRNNLNNILDSYKKVQSISPPPKKIPIINKNSAQKKTLNEVKFSNKKDKQLSPDPKNSKSPSRVIIPIKNSLNNSNITNRKKILSPKNK